MIRACGVASSNSTSGCRSTATASNDASPDPQAARLRADALTGERTLSRTLEAGLVYGGSI